MWLRPKRRSSAQATGQPIVLFLCAGVVQFSTDGDIRYATTLWLSLNFCSSNFNWTAALLYSGKVPCSSEFRTHGFSVCSCSLSLVRDKNMSSVPSMGWNLNHCFISFANLTNNAEQSASSETDCRPFFFLFFSPWRYTTHSGCVFYSPLSRFSLFAYEVTWSHTATRHSR